MEWKTLNLAEIYGAADNARMNQLQIQNAQMQMERERRALQEADALKGAYSVNPEGMLDEKTTLSNLYRISPLKAMEFQQALTKSKQDQQKLDLEAQNARLGQAEKLYTLMKSASGSVLANPTLDNAIMQTRTFGRLTGQNVDAEIANLQAMGDNPDAIKRWAAGHALNAEQLLPKADKVDNGQFSIDRTIDPLTGLPTEVSRTQKLSSPDALMTDKRTREEGALNRQVTIRGQDSSAATARRGQDITRSNAQMTDARERDKIKNPGKTQLSSSAQKELFEADEMAQASQNTIGMLSEALKLNDKAYSGFGAKERAVVRSNLPGQSDAADATVNLDNLMTGQALESLKATFGAAPTEGERKILMDMQASSDKTPKQRREIIQRAIQAADRRMKFNRSKADTLRKGTYFTDGIPAQNAPTPASGVIDFGSLK